jgi:hypothetical protein
MSNVLGKNKKDTWDMKPHHKIYMSFFDYSTTDFIPSELSGQRSIDLHHIERRGIGGSKQKDFIENLIALTREEHEKYGDRKQYMRFLYFKHLSFIRRKRPDYEIKFNLISLAYREQVMFDLGIKK